MSSKLSLLTSTCSRWDWFTLLQKKYIQLLPRKLAAGIQQMNSLEDVFPSQRGVCEVAGMLMNVFPTSFLQSTRTCSTRMSLLKGFVVAYEPSCSREVSLVTSNRRKSSFLVERKIPSPYIIWFTICKYVSYVTWHVVAKEHFNIISTCDSLS